MMRYIAIFISLILPFGLSAQLYVSSNQQLVIDAVKEAMFISRQSYCLLDKNDSTVVMCCTNLNSKVQYTLGVKLSGGICLNDVAMRPWLYDGDFSEYSNYIPSRKQEAYLEVSDTAKRGNLVYAPSSCIDIINKTLYWLPVNSFESLGLRPDTTLGNKEGWLVWVSVNKVEQNRIIETPEFVAYKRNYSITAVNNSFLLDAPNDKKNFIGAIYVVPVVTKVGTVEFRLCGIVYPEKDRWRLYSPFFRFGAVDAHPPHSEHMVSWDGIKE